MAHLTVYASDMTPELWVTAQYTHGLGRLPDAMEPRLSLVINGDMSLTLKYPFSGVNYSLLQNERLISAEGQLYRIRDIELHEDSGIPYAEVFALRLFYDLQNSEIANIETSETDLDGITQTAALTLILNGTSFTVGTIDNTTTLEYLDILQKSPFWALKEQILGLWGGELDPDNWTINVRTAVGSATRKYPIRRGRNIKGIVYKESLDGMITRLHVSGYGGATFEDINDNKDYIDSANLVNYTKVYEGRIEFPDDDLSADLMAKGVAHLATVDTPRSNYEIDLVCLKNSSQYALYSALETFNLGDTALIHHTFFNVDITARAMSLERDPVTGDNVKVTLGNYSKNLYKTLSDASHAADAVEGATDANGFIRGAKLRGTIDMLTARLKMSGSYTNATVLENQGFLVENTNTESADYGAMYIGCGIFALANSKNGDNSWNWQTFGTPGGFSGYYLVANSVTANKLAADVATALDLSSNVSVNSLVSQAVSIEAAALEDAMYSYVQQTASDLTATIATEHTYTVEVGGALETYKELIAGWIRFDGDVLEMGKSDSPFKSLLSNTKLSFTQDGVELAFFANNKLHVVWVETDKLSLADAAGGYMDLIAVNSGLQITRREA